MSVGVRTIKLGKRAALALVAGCACLAILPPAIAAVDAASVDSSPRSLSLTGSDLGSFTPTSANPRLIAALASAKSKAGHDDEMFRFTPAASKKSGKRAVTLAVRVDADSSFASGFSRNALNSAQASSGVAPVAFNLGMARGYQSFSQPAKVSSDLNLGAGKGLSTSSLAEIDTPDLTRFTPAKKSEKSRFGTVVELDDNISSGAVPRSFDGGDRSVDVGGSYRVTGNLRVTAGVRYSDDPNRIAPLSDSAQDSQSVYVGTRFRF